MMLRMELPKESTFMLHPVTCKRDTCLLSTGSKTARLSDTSCTSTHVFSMSTRCIQLVYICTTYLQLPAWPRACRTLEETHTGHSEHASVHALYLLDTLIITGGCNCMHLLDAAHVSTHAWSMLTSKM